MTTEEKWQAVLDCDKDIIAKAKKWIIPSMSTDDIIQDLRLWLFKELDKFDPFRSGIRTYCNLCMIRRLGNLKRDQGRKPLNKSVFIGNDDIALVSGRYVVLNQKVQNEIDDEE